VYVPLPTGLHAHWVDRALATGKHVLCEKPLTESLADSTRLVSQARVQGLTLLENFMFLRHAQHAAVLSMIEAGVIGEVRAISSAFTFPPPPASDIRYQPGLGGGALLDAGVYPIRAAQYLLGAALSVAGASLCLDKDTGVDVAGSALLCTPAGITAQLTWGFRHYYRCCYEVLGSAGRITLDRSFTPPGTHRPVVRIERPDGAEERTLPADDQFANVATAFTDAVASGRPPAGESLSGDAILRQAKLVDDIRANAVWSRS
jgi:NDP-hexose-3-ketoreductase